jgi:hypothetical protein
MMLWYRYRATTQQGDKAVDSVMNSRTTRRSMLSHCSGIKIPHKVALETPFQSGTGASGRAECSSIMLLSGAPRHEALNSIPPRSV